jgi:hypothetical protein
MSQDLPIPRQDRSDGTSVVEWGAAEPAPAGRAGRNLAGLARDHRLPAVLAGLGAVAAVASMIGEWLVMTVPNEGPEGTAVRVPLGVGEIGGFGVGYLVGLLGLAGAVALAVRGTTTVRPNARVLGLGLAAASLALLVAAAFSLGDSAQRSFYATADGFRVEYGRGLVSAFVAILLLAAAVQRSGRQGERESDPDGEPTTAENGQSVPARRRSRDEDLPPAPADLTVEPTAPFARPDPPR